MNLVLVDNINKTVVVYDSKRDMTLTSDRRGKPTILGVYDLPSREHNEELVDQIEHIRLNTEPM